MPDYVSRYQRDYGDDGQFGMLSWTTKGFMDLTYLSLPSFSFSKQ